MIALARRVARMSGAEVRFRAGAFLRTQAQRLQVQRGRVSWDRRDIGRVLSRDVLSRVAPALRARDWSQVDDTLLSILEQRESRFVIEPRSAEALTHEITSRWPGAPASASSLAGDILAGRFDLLGYEGLSFTPDGRVDWHLDPVHGRRAPLVFWADVPFLDPRCGDHKIIWELNRHQYFLRLGRALWLTGRHRYGARIVADIRSWVVANPPLHGINWASMLELAFRCIAWTAGIHFLLGRDPQCRSYARVAGDDPWLVDTLVALDRQLTHVEHNLSEYFSPNTHLTGEALALYVVGAAFPELAASARWLATGRAVLLREATRQVAPDGGHAELSTWYHRYTLEFYALALQTAERLGDGDAAEVFRQTLGRLASYLDAFTDVTGRIPLIGDDDGGSLWPLTARDPADVRDVLATAGVLLDRPDLVRGHVPEEALWLTWSARPSMRSERKIEATKPPARSLSMHHFSDTGYVVARTGAGDHLTFDTGPHGFRNGGHAHADALSLTLSIHGRPLLVDVGTATYTMDARLRDRMRDSRSHNTVTLGDRSLAVPDGPFHWRSRAAAQLDVARSNPGFLLACGRHDGYAPAVHTRALYFERSTGWVIIDRVSGHQGPVDAHWHFHPQWQLNVERPGLLRATDSRDDTIVWLLHDQGTATLRYGDDSGAGWWSPRYGALDPTFTARVSLDAVDASTLVTWIAAGTATVAPSLQVTTSGGGRGTATTIRLIGPGHASTLHFEQADSPRDPRGVRMLGDALTSDARLVHVGTSGQDGGFATIVDGSTFTSIAGPIAEAQADTAIPDLHIVAHGSVVEAWSSSPPAGLRLRWPAGHPPGSLWLNGREASRALARGTVTVVTAADWGDAALTAREDWSGQRTAWQAVGA